MLGFIVVIDWALWWFSCQQSRFLYIPLVLMMLMVLVHWEKLTKIMMCALTLALILTGLSVVGAHRRDFGRSRYEVLRDKDKSILIAPKPKKNTLHPTMKPVSLLRRLILNSTNIGDVVYDPFAGSGSSLLACEQTKRRCLMVELEPRYCQVIIDRFEKLTGLKALPLTPEL